LAQLLGLALPAHQALAAEVLKPINEGPAVVVEQERPAAPGPVNIATEEAPVPVGAVNAGPEPAVPKGNVVNEEKATPEPVVEEAAAAPAFEALNTGVESPGPAQRPPVKLGRNGECLPQGTSYYETEQIFTPYPSIEACLAAGGRLIPR